MSKLQERIDRVNAAIRLEQVDKIPFLSGGPAAMAAYEKVLLKDYCNDMELNCTTNLEFCKDFNVDGTQAAIFNPRVLINLWFAEVRLPGAGVVPDNDLWQIEEAERMKFEDYARIRDMGFDAWADQFIHTQYGNILEDAAPYFSYYPTAIRRFEEAGIPSFCDSILASPFEMLCGARSLAAFLDDLIEEPEEVEETLDLVHKRNMAAFEALFRDSPVKPRGVWVGGWRGTPGMLSPAMFERFSWKYMREYIDLCIQYDVIPVCHLDSDWTLGMHYFRELPSHKMILALDGQTDIFKAREVIGNHSCIMGDVPASMLAFGKTQDVYDYCMRLIREIGPAGYIMCSGCDVPYNADFDNVRQMQKAVEDYSKIQ